MLNNGKIKVKVWDKEFTDYTDITDGTLSISTQTGVDYFQGFWDTIEPGQFTIVSRNDSLDPYKNNIIRQGSLIEITVEKEGFPVIKPIFIGFITDFNVEYRKDDKPLITINGTDYLGVLNRTLITQELMDEKILPISPEGIVTFKELINDIIPVSPYLTFQYASRANPPGFLGVYYPYEEEVPPGPLVKLEVGKNFLDAINEGISSGLIELNNLGGGTYALYPFYKYDPVYYYINSLEDTAVDYWIFKSHNPQQGEEGDIELSYKFININDGFDRMVNQVSVTNTDPTTGVSEEFETAFNLEQIAEWGPMNITASTTFSTDINFMVLQNNSIANQVARYQQDILDYQSVPEIEINSITVDMINQYYNTPYGFAINIYLPESGSLFEIEHKIDENTTINRKLIVCGVKHQITVDSWNAEFVLRKAQDYYAQTKKLKKPVINLPKTTGTSGETFTASVSNYNSADWAKVARVEWMVCMPDFYGYNMVNPPSQYKYYGVYEFQDAPIFTGQTVSWNYDDNGPLAGYYKPNDPNFLNMFVGPGEYEVFVWVTSHDGHVTRSDATGPITVTAATAYANFFFTKDQYERITFSDISGADTNTWSWNFGDGTTYNGKTPPLKEYSAPGTYNVTLTVNNGYDSDTIVKPVTVVQATIPVKYIRVRFQGTVTKPAGQADYTTTDLIDTIGGLRLRNLSNIDVGGTNPFYIIARTLDKVEIVGEERTTVPVPAPIFTTNYSSGGPLDPMSQNAWSGWSLNPANLGGGVIPKYKFHPVITNNPDGSQTKTYDFDLIFQFDKLYSGTGLNYYGAGVVGLYERGGVPANIINNTFWGAGGSSSYDQRYKLNQFWPYAAVLFDDEYGKHGTASDGRAYVPATIAVSADGITYKQVGTATWTGPGAPSVSYLGTMPPKTTLPTQP